MAQKKSTSEHIKNARRWQRHLQMWRETGQTQVEYCRVNNLGVKAFGYWLRKDRKSNNPSPLLFGITTPKGNLGMLRPG